MARLARHPEVVYTDLEDGAVLLHLETKFYYSLNEVGQAIWRLLDSSESVAGLTRKLRERYEVQEVRAEGSVSRFLQELEREQLVVPASGGSEAAAMVGPGDWSASTGAPAASPRPFSEPELIKHDEPLHDVVMNPFDPQLPLAE